ncbi:GNAT family N-acetyltransferase [Halomonas sp. SpR1]|uniref:GNAT family N-acetyltransferase n=1 Tax=Halomonas sp. SpR1 TaxID=3050462 RepID=UPI0027E4AEC8|nr:GNAT family N-acetyltransferase [Halomonas sp. SpR1]MDQ7735760.1 GNAT family N-acetyltransferase [Halomonas sp. SpR1]
MEIRQVQLGELDEVLDLFDEYDRPRSPKPTNEALRAIHASISQSGGCVVGAFVEKDLVGTCTVNLCPNLSWSGRPYAIIENVIVSIRFRNQGVGKALLQYAKRFAQEAGCYKVALMTGSKDPAIHHFYESIGFSASKQGYQHRFNA